MKGSSKRATKVAEPKEKEDSTPLLDRVQELVAKEKSLITLELLQRENDAKAWKARYDDLARSVLGHVAVDANVESGAIELLAQVEDEEHAKMDSSSSDSSKRMNDPFWIVAANMGKDSERNRQVVTSQGIGALKALDLSKTAVRLPDIQRGLKVMRLLTSLKSVNLSRCSLTDDASAELTVLMRIPNLESIDISHNLLGEAGGLSVCAGIQESRRCPQFLQLHGQQGGMDASKAFVEAFILSLYQSKNASTSVFGLSLSLRDVAPMPGEAGYMQMQRMNALAVLAAAAAQDGGKDAKAAAKTDKKRSSSPKRKGGDSSGAGTGGGIANLQDSTLCLAETFLKALVGFAPAPKETSAADSKKADAKKGSRASSPSPAAKAGASGAGRGGAGGAAPIPLVPQLTSLSLRDCTLTEPSLRQLMTVLTVSPMRYSLSNIDLSYTFCGLRGTMAVCALLVDSACILSSLTLVGCAMRASSAEALAHALVNNCTVTSLNVRSNYIDYAGASAICNAVIAKSTRSHTAVGTAAVGATRHDGAKGGEGSSSSAGSSNGGKGGVMRNIDLRSNSLSIQECLCLDNIILGASSTSKPSSGDSAHEGGSDSSSDVFIEPIVLLTDYTVTNTSSTIVSSLPYPSLQASGSGAGIYLTSGPTTSGTVYTGGVTSMNSLVPLPPRQRNKHISEGRGAFNLPATYAQPARTTASVPRSVRDESVMYTIPCVNALPLSSAFISHGGAGVHANDDIDSDERFDAADAVVITWDARLGLDAMKSSSKGASSSSQLSLLLRWTVTIDGFSTTRKSKRNPVSSSSSHASNSASGGDDIGSSGSDNDDDESRSISLYQGSVIITPEKKQMRVIIPATVLRTRSDGQIQIKLFAPEAVPQMHHTNDVSSNTSGSANGGASASGVGASGGGGGGGARALLDVVGENLLCRPITLGNCNVNKIESDPEWSSSSSALATVTGGGMLWTWWKADASGGDDGDDEDGDGLPNCALSMLSTGTEWKVMSSALHDARKWCLCRRFIVAPPVLPFTSKPSWRARGVRARISSGGEQANDTSASNSSSGSGSGSGGDASSCGAMAFLSAPPPTIVEGSELLFSSRLMCKGKKVDGRYVCYEVAAVVIAPDAPAYTAYSTILPGGWRAAAESNSGDVRASSSHASSGAEGASSTSSRMRAWMWTQHRLPLPPLQHGAQVWLVAKPMHAGDAIAASGGGGGGGSGPVDNHKRAPAVAVRECCLVYKNTDLAGTNVSARETLGGASPHFGCDAVPHVLFNSSCPGMF